VSNGAGRWLAVWNSTESLGGTIGTDWDVLVASSTDDGGTWTAVSALNGNAGSDIGSDYGAELATDAAGSWLAVWRSNDSLMDDGATWTAPAALNDNAETDSGNDGIPYAATEGAGGWLVVWDSADSLDGAIGTDHDILFTLGWGPDLDGDGLSDGEEVNVHGTDPLDTDTDDDGLSDGDEVNVHATDPLDSDSDDDGFSDGDEVAAGSDPNDENSTPTIAPVPALGPWGLFLLVGLLVASALGLVLRRSRAARERANATVPS